jgi:TRAP transporter TAXI family solute receptor
MIVAAVLALTAASAFVVQRFFAPTVLRVAVGPVGSADTKLVATILQIFAREKHPIRLRIVPTDNPVASAEALRAGRVDAALVRSDGNLPPNATTVAILHRDAFMLMVPATTDISSLGDLKGRKIGIIRGYALNQKLADLVLQANGVQPDETTKVQINPTDLKDAIATGRIDAVLVVGPPASSTIAQIYSDLYSPAGQSPVILPIPAPEAIAQRNPTLETAQVLKGTFGGTPLKPERTIDTIAVTHRLVVDRGIRDSVAEAFARSLFDIRQSVAAEFPNFAQIEAPDTEKLGPLIVHPGAAAYFDGETKTFIEQYGEWIYIAIMVVSLAGSVLAAVLSRRFAHNKPPGKAEIDRMLLLLRQARSSASVEDLDRIQTEADEVFGRTVERAAGAEVDEAVLSAFTIALSEVRTAIEERRGVLSKEFVGLAG